MTRLDWTNLMTPMDFEKFLIAARSNGVAQFSVTPEGLITVVFGPIQEPTVDYGPGDWKNPDTQPPAWVTADVSEMDKPFND